MSGNKFRGGAWRKEVQEMSGKKNLEEGHGGEKAGNERERILGSWRKGGVVKKAGREAYRKEWLERSGKEDSRRGIEERMAGKMWETKLRSTKDKRTGKEWETKKARGRGMEKRRAGKEWERKLKKGNGERKGRKVMGRR